MPTAATITLKLAHSPDPDDAFMWWPLFEIEGRGPAVPGGRFHFESVQADIETLNRRALAGEYEITAMSCAQYPRVRDRYVLTACGASLGEGVGPRLVAREPKRPDELRGPIAVPGEGTSAFAALVLLLGRGAFRHVVVPFDQIVERVCAGEFEAGLVIHEGQLTYEAAGLHLVCDLGAWWTAKTRLPLPLGVNALRRDLDRVCGAGTLPEVASLLRRSLDHAMAHRDESLRHAVAAGRGIGRDDADRFVGMYVNGLTLEFGERGRRAVAVFLDEIHRAGIAPAPGPVEIVPTSPERARW